MQLLSNFRGNRIENPFLGQLLAQCSVDDHMSTTSIKPLKNKDLKVFGVENVVNSNFEINIAYILSVKYAAVVSAPNIVDGSKTFMLEYKRSKK